MINANIFYFYQLFICANLRRHQGKPTYGVQSLSARFLFMPTLINGALENSTLRNLFKIQQTMSVKSANQKSQSLTNQFNPTKKREP